MIKANFLALLIPLILIISCKDSSAILERQDFRSGKWLLVNVNHANGTLLVIDDQTVLRTNPKGLNIAVSGEEPYTTNDGFIMLFKDGQLIEQQAYLDQSRLTESRAIKHAYKSARDSVYYPVNTQEFQIIWDSLRNAPNNYPTKHHQQPTNKDIIWNYKYDR